ncbi:aromatic acid exporter family protein [Falsibacillus albus]|uniref:aromatic acid exporter family protein n=1 Tax=Falsibacillus albus TaxID=2478915 RepID=UPI001F323798|nr:aromatic acid exporter family protein [Falsibacillus albus]
MKYLKQWKIIGGRTVKTGIAVFFTSLICHLLNWPSVFAVVTSIVTIEPTASDSIRKGMVRFPASAIGAAFAMVLTSYFGDEPLTYAFAAIFTIAICHRLKLHAGMVVATLTAVAMIPATHDHFLINFLVRLGTTTIGLVVSTVVNLFIMPPNYSKIIFNSVHNLYIRTGNILERRMMEILHLQPIEKRTKNLFIDLVNDLRKAEKLCEYQREEWKFHRNSKEEMRQLHYLQKKIHLLRQIVYHLGNIIYMPSSLYCWPENEKEKVLTAIQSLTTIIQEPRAEITAEHNELINELVGTFWEQKGQIPTDHCHHFSPETVILYELLSIHDLLEERRQIQEFEMRRQKALASPIRA